MEKLPKSLMDYIEKYGYIERHGDVLAAQKIGENAWFVIFTDTFQGRFEYDERLGWSWDVFWKGRKVKYIDWKERPKLDDIAEYMLEHADGITRDELIAKAVLKFHITIREASDKFVTLRNLGLIEKKRGKYVRTR